MGAPLYLTYHTSSQVSMQAVNTGQLWNISNSYLIYSNVMASCAIKSSSWEWLIGGLLEALGFFFEATRPFWEDRGLQLPNMVLDTQHITVGRKLPKWLNFGVILSEFWLAETTYLRPTLNSWAQVHAFWYQICSSGQNNGRIDYILGFKGLVQMTYLRPRLNFSAWVHAFY